MKHIRMISATAPARAAAWQDILCQITQIVSAVITALGGSSPLVTLIDDKCTIPDPNPDTTDN